MLVEPTVGRELADDEEVADGLKHDSGCGEVPGSFGQDSEVNIV